MLLLFMILTWRDIMQLVIIIAIISLTILAIIKLFVNDDSHDLEIIIGKNKLSIKKHKKK